MSSFTRDLSNKDIASFTLKGGNQFESFREALEKYYSDQGVPLLSSNGGTRAKALAAKGKYAAFVVHHTESGTSQLLLKEFINEQETSVMALETAGRNTLIQLDRNSPIFPVIAGIIDTLRENTPVRTRDMENAFYYFKNDNQTAAFIAKVHGFMESKNIAELTPDSKDGTFFSLNKDSRHSNQWQLKTHNLSPGGDKQSDIATLVVHGGHTKLHLHRNATDFNAFAQMAFEAKTEHAPPRQKPIVKPLSKRARRLAELLEPTHNVSIDFMSPEMQQWAAENKPALQNGKALAERMDWLRDQIKQTADVEARLRKYTDLASLEHYARERSENSAANESAASTWQKTVAPDHAHEAVPDELLKYIERAGKGNAR